MFNRPTNLLAEAQAPDQFDQACDRGPVLRLVVLFGLFLIPLSVVAGKLAYLQIVSSDDFSVAATSKYTESFETLSTTDGRILLAGTVLARDVPIYQLKMHYRWLEEPVNERWLRRKALARMNKADRKNKELVQQFKNQVLLERSQMWKRLGKILGWKSDELKHRREAVQRRIERIADIVDERQRQRILETERHRLREIRRNQHSDSWWEAHWETVKRELTTPPTRTRRDKLVIQEELDYHVIAKDIPFEKIADLISRPELFPGLDYEMATRREYPQADLLAHVIGSRQPADSSGRSTLDELANDSQDILSPSRFNETDAREIDRRVGQFGVEATYDQELRGRAGLRRIVRDQSGEIIRSEIVRKPRAGLDVELSIVEPIQRLAEGWLDELVGPNPNKKMVANGNNAALPLPATPLPEPNSTSNKRPPGACILAMNVHTGELLVAACAPRFDLQMLVEFDQEKWDDVTNDPRFPMFSRVAQMALPPGSVFKTVTAIAGLQHGSIQPDEHINCIGHLLPNNPNKYRCYTFKHGGHGHGEVDLHYAICRSCNVYFYQAARVMGPEPILSWARRIGFGRPTGVDLPNEAAGNLSDRLSKTIQLTSFEHSSKANNQHAISQSDSRPSWRKGDTLGLAIGQADLTVTPLQIVRLMAMVANGGELVTPHVASELRSRSTHRSHRIDARRQKLNISQRTLHFVREGLELVVASNRGTGRRVRLDEVTIAGKTGTAEVGGGKTDHAWFAGYTPAERPQVAFVVVVENGGSGGANAGPLAKKLVQALVKHKLVVRKSNEQNSAD